MDPYRKSRDFEKSFQSKGSDSLHPYISTRQTHFESNASIQTQNNKRVHKRLDTNTSNLEESINYKIHLQNPSQVPKKILDSKDGYQGKKGSSDFYSNKVGNHSSKHQFDSVVSSQCTDRRTVVEKNFPQTDNFQSNCQSQNDGNFTCPIDEMSFSSGREDIFISTEQQEQLERLQESQEELSFLKFKLTEAYEKLEREILYSGELQDKIEYLKDQLMQSNELISIEQRENKQLKFTLTAIANNKRTMEQNIQALQRDLDEQKQSNLLLRSQVNQNLGLKQKQEQLRQTEDSLVKKNAQLNTELSQNIKRLTQLEESLKSQSNESTKLERLLQSEQQENKKLLKAQAENLSKINSLEGEVRRVTDEKVLTVNRLTHELAISYEKQREQTSKNCSMTSEMRKSATCLEQVQQKFSPLTSISKGKKLSRLIHEQAQIKDSEDEIESENSCVDSVEDDSLQIEALSRNLKKGSLENPNEKTPLSKRKIQDKQNYNIISNQPIVNSYNRSNTSKSPYSKNALGRQQKSQKKSQPTNSRVSQGKQSNKSPIKETKVGKWKRAPSVASNMSHYQSRQECGFESIRQKESNASFVSGNNHSAVILKESEKVQSDDQKLTKCQIHRKMLESELFKLEKIKRPTHEERTKITKLEKQLYHLDSDIAGLKRVVRHKY